MPRKLSAKLDYKLRIREALRRRIEQAATKRGVSANAEMVYRLEHSFEEAAARSAAEIVEDMQNIWARYGDMFHSLNKQGDLIRAATALLKQIDAGDDRGTVKAAERVRHVIEVIELEAASLPAKMHTTGDERA